MAIKTSLNKLDYVQDRWYYVDIAGSGDIVFAGTWVNFGGTTQRLRYKRLQNGQCHLQGTIKNGGANTVCTLPVGYRPIVGIADAPTYHLNGATNNVGRSQITTAGVVIVLQSQGTTRVVIDIVFDV